MKRKEGYDLIGEYLDGGLTSEATEEFEGLLANDSELAAELRSEELIRSTLANDAATMPVGLTEPSALLNAKLAATSATSGGSGAALAGATGGSNLLGTIFGTAGGLSVVTAIGILGLFLGAYLFSERPATTDDVQSSEQSGGVVIEELQLEEPGATEESQATEQQPTSATPKREALREHQNETPAQPAITTTEETQGPPTETPEELLKRLRSGAQHETPLVKDDTNGLEVQLEP